MLTLEWRLTLLGVLVLPAFIFTARRLGKKLRHIAREAMDYNAQMNAIMSETLNIGGVLLVKLFGRDVNRSRALPTAAPRKCAILASSGRSSAASFS